VPVGNGKSVGAKAKVVEGEGEAPATKVMKGRTVKLLWLGGGAVIHIEPAATSNVSHQMTVIFCEHKNNSGGVQQIFTLHFHILLLLIYF